MKKDEDIDMVKIDEFVKERLEARKIVEEMDKKIDLYDFIVRKRERIIAVQHGDGSYLEFHSACCRKISKHFFAVFTEHQGTHLYHTDDIDWIKEWKRPKYLYYNRGV